MIVCNDGTQNVDINTGSLEDAGGAAGAARVFAETLAGVAMTSGDAVVAGQTFAVVIDTDDSGDDGANPSVDGCQAGVGDTQELRLIVDGGGETYSQLTFNSITAGSLIV